MKNREHVFVTNLLEWSEKNLRDFPWRNTNSPYEILIAEILLKRTTSTAAKKAYFNILKHFPDLNSINLSKNDDLTEILVPLGLYRQRATGLKEISKYIIEHNNGKIPSEYDELLKVPNIGPYSAGAIMSFAYDKPYPIVDSNVKRVMTNVFGDIFNQKTKNEEINNFLFELIPNDRHKKFNLALLDLGSQICSYRKKECKKCPLGGVCYNHKNKFNID